MNESSKGPTLFDAEAAAMVMATYQREGVDMMIDLNHEALDSMLVRPDCADARGWAQLELREDGSLWAVNVRWTPDGARRLTEKTQRYISPAFCQDEKTGRVTTLINCAIVAMPATYDAPALVAAARAPLARVTSRASVRNTMDPEQLKAAIDAITDGSLAKALGLDAGAKPSEILDVLNGAIAALGPDGGKDEGADDAAPESPDAPPADPMAASAAPVMNSADPVGAELMRVLGTATVVEALGEIGALVASRSKIDSDRAAFELSQRLELVAELVKLDAETPATAWADTDKKILCKRLLSEPLAELRTRVTALRGKAPKAKVEPPATGAVIELTAEQKRACKRAKITEAEFIARRNAVEVRRL
jgi:phage I-like protein